MKSLTRIVKLCFTLFLLNLYILPGVFGTSLPRCTEVTTIISLGAIGLDFLISSVLTKRVLKTVSPMVVYLVYIAVSGLILAVFSHYEVLLLYPYVEKVIVATIVTYIIVKDGSGEYIFFLGILLATTVGIYVLSSTVASFSRLHLSGNLTPNSLGLLFTFGVISTFLTRKHYFNKYIKLILNLIFIFVIVLTASRQSLLIISIVYLGWFWRTRISVEDHKKGSLKISSLVFACFCIGVVIYLLNSGVFDALEETKLFARLMGESDSTAVSDATRRNLYQVGMEAFYHSPFIGRGYNNLSTYTHSTYMEVLGGTGFIGLLLFYYPFIKHFVLARRCYKKSDVIEDKCLSVEKITLVIALFVMMFFRGIHYYIISCIIIALLLNDLKPQEKPLDVNEPTQNYNGRWSL